MDHTNDQLSGTWPERVADGVEKFRKLIDETEGKSDGQQLLAWCGHARQEWQIETALEKHPR